ncbi:ATP-binding protein [Comamonas endophytica]|uniref:histidine kinase n=1 Tax=Comamonas endophytica TaxID=2949090 RepID=A0ABY6GF28_9BURK|nr:MULTISPECIES: ATP-binding protein [unclassified Acidovorax]MCD2512670.1 ATP-binding protein [Acidovorax sp. D4N7]UYG52972.1 ATP-binding protein [Acidovorax sp. 5MLIR]
MPTPAAPTPAAPMPASRWSRTVRWAVGVGVALMCAMGLVLMFMLALATNNREAYERNYSWLFTMNVLVAAVLLGLLLWGGVRLALRLRRGRFGSRLLLKLAGIFALVGVVPGLLIYVVSYQFVSRSIESWFDVKVEGALSAGVSLASVTLDTVANDMAHNTRTASESLAQVPNAAAGFELERIREQLGAIDVVLWSASGKVLASVGPSKFDLLLPERPSAQQMRALREQQASARIEGLDDVSAVDDPEALARMLDAVRVRTLALVPNPAVGLLAEARYVQATLKMPVALLTNAMAVQEANREYQERALAREGLQRMYIGTLTLSLFLAVFGAILLAVVLGNQLARPLLLLAQGVREVARGDLRPKASLPSADELSGLTRAFALMTRQLAEAHAAVGQSMADVDAARSNLQTILDNLTSGVIVLDETGHVVSSNPGATRILRVPMAAYQGRLLEEVPGLAEFAQMVREQFAQFLGERGAAPGRDRWQMVHEVHGTGGGGGVVQDSTSLVVRGAELPGSQRLLVFDDISEIVSAQRAQAWGEVARRVAHEIKNPLTPIQLSAERLAMKLMDKLAPTEQALLGKSVKTIVEQVGAMKHLVDEFRDYARLPAAQLVPLDLNGLLADVLHLYGEENAAVRINAQLDPNCPWIAGDAQQLRQIVHNLLQNAQHATEQAAAENGSAPEAVELATQWNEVTGRVHLSISDRGTGFPANILQRAFEPYVTTKARGTGLGLAVVKKIADEHSARINLSNRVENGVVRGAQVSLSFAPVTKVLAEDAAQRST